MSERQPLEKAREQVRVWGGGVREPGVRAGGDCQVRHLSSVRFGEDRLLGAGWEGMHRWRDTQRRRETQGENVGTKAPQHRACRPHGCGAARGRRPPSQLDQRLRGLGPWTHHTGLIRG